MTAHPFELEDSELWGNPSEALEAFCAARAPMAKEEILIDAPEEVPLDVRSTLRLQIYRGAMLRDMLAARFEDHAVLSAVHLESSQVLVRRALRSREMPVDTAGDLEDPGETFCARLYAPELRERLELPWKPGTWLVTLLMRDRASNRVRVRLGPSPLAYRDLEVERYLASLQWPTPAPPWPAPASVFATRPPNEPVPAGAQPPLPWYGALPETPAVPKELGIALTLERVVVASTTARLVLRGSFRLPVRQAEIVPPLDSKQPEQALLARPKAIVPITLVLLGSEVLGPVSIPLRLPSYDPFDPAARSSEVTGSFNLDLLRLEAMPRLPQTYFVYALSGEALAGPVLTAFVSEDRLPVPAR